MYAESNGPIIHRGEPRGNKNILVIVGALVMAIGLGAFFLIQENAPEEVEAVEAYELYDIAAEEAVIEDETSLPEPLPAIETIPEELSSAAAYYQRALKKEKEKDYEGAVADYTKTIALAKKYSSEMWNALNNRGVIYTKQLIDYKAAIKDFNKIVQIESNRYDGHINETRLEAGYTNRAYVKMMKGDKEGACNDLYEALALGVESSSSFIENKIAKNCD